MSTSEQQDPLQEANDRPPVFANWSQVYAFVLILHAILLILFYLFTQMMS